MNISLITLHNVKNYGSALQTYATQHILEKIGCNVEFVDFWREDLRNEKRLVYMLASSHKWNKNILTRLIYRIIQWPSIQKQCKVFDGFLKKHIKLTKTRYYSIEDLKANPPQANIYCTGSDQTWNSNYNRGILEPFFLEYAPCHAHKIAFAASFGKEELDTWEQEKTRQLLSKYKHISVREKSAVKILKQLGLIGTQVLDPTLLMCSDAWGKLSMQSKSMLLPKQYVLIYQLNQNSLMDHYARSIARKHKIRLLRVSTALHQAIRFGTLVFCPTPEEWLALFASATYIVTDSFHGTAFSINFNKQFISVLPEEYSTRLTSILELTGLTDRILRDYNDYSIMDRPIDYQLVNTILEQEREKADEFLKKALAVEKDDEKTY